MKRVMRKVPKKWQGKRFLPWEFSQGLPYEDDTSDFHFICDSSTPKDERLAKNIGDNYVNAVRCLKCNEVIRSKNRHDYRSCKCGSISVDGGSMYLKRSGNIDASEDLSQEFDDVRETSNRT